MKIVILGAGQVGSTVASALVHEDNDITIVDVDERRLKELQDQLVAGSLSIIKVDDGHELVPARVAQKISQRDPSCVISLGTGRPENIDADDPYADYKVPDDLMW